LPAYFELMNSLHVISKENQNLVMLARTHGQPAIPTTFGKEMGVFVYRLDQAISFFSNLKHTTKFGGAVGNLNAHYAAYPSYDWNKFADDFCLNSLNGLIRQQLTTQIENYDQLSSILENLKRLNIILLDFSKDIWDYISRNYLTQKIKSNEVGSSAMPHKVNPIDFENAEGNLVIANSILSTIADKLPISRLQRDLTDSTVLRNLGSAFGYILIAINSLRRGISKISPNQQVITEDLDSNWQILAEAVQTILRRENHPNPYDLLKSLTRTGSSISKQDFQNLILQMDLPENVKKEILSISPQNYIGNSAFPLPEIKFKI